MQSALIQAMVMTLVASLCMPGCKQKEPAQPAKSVQSNTAQPKAAQRAAADGPAKVAKPTGARKFASPQEVFEECQSAIAAKDFGRFVDGVAPTARRDLAAGMVMMLGFLTIMAKDAKPQVEALVKKHGIPDAKAMKQWKGGKEDVMARLKESIKDPRALVVDALGLFEQILDKQRKKSGDKGKVNTPAEGMVLGKLIDVKVEGDRATAKLQREKGQAKSMDFIKLDGSWYLMIDVK